MDVVIQAAALALAVGVVAQIGSQAQISKPVRDWLKHKNTWLFDLMSCPFCSSIWLAAAGTLITRPWLVPGFILIRFGVTFLAVSGASMLPVLWIRKALSIHH